MGLIYGIGLRLMNFMVFFLILILLPGLPPRTTFSFREFEITPNKELKGALEPNHHLDGAERLLEGRVYGPECLIARKNEIYTGIHGGEIIKLTGDHVTHVAKIGQPCEEIFEESICGRPLGLAFDTQGNNLIVADGYYGLWEVGLTTKKKKLLVSAQQELPGEEVDRKARIFNSVTVDQQGDIYWTDSSSDFEIQDLIFIGFANPSGRLFKYNRSKNVSQVLLDELYFPNGLALSPAEDFIVIAETGRMHLIKYHLKGAKAGKSEVFVEGLPGLPDNITPDEDGLWVPLVMAVDSENPNGYVMFSQFPTLRLFLARLLSLIEMPFRLINNVYPNKLTKRFVHFIGHGESSLLFAPKRATIVRVDWNGNIVGSLHGFDKSVGSVSHVLEFNDYLYLGSPFNRFLARVKSPKSPKQHGVKVKNVRYEGAMEPVVKTPTEATTKKPAVTPTTAKPTTTSTTTTTTTTPRPATTTATPTTAPKPKVKPATATTPKPATTAKPVTAQKPTTAPKAAVTPKAAATPKPATTKRVPPKDPAPVQEEIPNDTKPPKNHGKLKVVDKHGSHVEL